MKSIDIFPWNINFNTGIALIDEQHQRLAELLNALASQVAFQTDPDVLDRVFAQLADYAVYHFESEEAIWREHMADDELMCVHEAGHGSFLTTVSEIKRRSTQQDNAQVMDELLAFLTRWLASHILESDRYMAAVVQALQSGLPMAAAKGWAHDSLKGSSRTLIDIILAIYASLSTNTLHLMQELAEHKTAEAQLRVAAAAFESQEGTFVTDAQGVILRVNNAFTRITGYTAEQAIGKTPKLLSSGRHDAAFYADMWAHIHEHGFWEGEIWNRSRSGVLYPEYLRITAVKDEEERVVNYVASFADISRSKDSEEEIQRLAFYDQLTRLPNRRLLLERLKHAVVLSDRTGQDGAVLFMDLDNFKVLNDTLGHDVGDLLLQQVAQRVTQCLREGDTVARLGGDEFVVMLQDLSAKAVEAAAQAEAIADKILNACREPYQLGPHEYRGGASIGITLFNPHDRAVDDLLKHADIAMYQAKKEGRNGLRFFDATMQEAINAQAALHHDLRQAVELQQFELYYQIQTQGEGRVLGAEALVRWHHPTQGLVLPTEFIGMAEDTGLILPLGRWVLERACAQLQAWQAQPHRRTWVLGVNVSAKQFRQPDFVQQVQSALQRYKVPPMLLKLELTESLLLDSVEDTIAIMLQLRALGVVFSLDDFGTGYSSLQYLKLLPLSQLKIDQSFVRDIAVDASDRAIVRTIIAMAGSLELDVIAEGVETQEQRQCLLEDGCTSFQGYCFGVPLPIEAFEAKH